MMRETDICECKFVLFGSVNKFYTTYNIYEIVKVSLSHDDKVYVETKDFHFEGNEVYYDGEFVDGDYIKIEYIGIYEEIEVHGGLERVFEV